MFKCRPEAFFFLKLIREPQLILQYVSSNQDRKRNPQPDLEIYYFSESRIQLASYIISILFSGILLVGAMACLSLLNNYSWKLRLGIVAMFTSLFGVIIGLLTNARRVEIFASAAAYTAVLVVYVSANLGPPVQGGSM